MLSFLDLLDICHVLGDHFLVVSPLSPSSLTSGVSFFVVLGLFLNSVSSNP